MALSITNDMVYASGPVFWTWPQDAAPTVLVPANFKTGNRAANLTTVSLKVTTLTAGFTFQQLTAVNTWSDLRVNSVFTMNAVAFGQIRLSTKSGIVGNATLAYTVTIPSTAAMTGTLTVYANARPKVAAAPIVQPQKADRLVLTSAILNATDIESKASDLTFHVESDMEWAGVSLQLLANGVWSSTTSFTPADISSGSISLNFLGSGAGSGSIMLSVTDGLQTVGTGWSVYHVQAPTVSAYPLKLPYNGTVAISQSSLWVTSGYASAQSLVFTVTAVPDQGSVVFKSGNVTSAIAVDDTFTAADIADGNLQYVAAPAWNGTTTWAATITDGLQSVPMSMTFITNALPYAVNLPGAAVNCTRMTSVSLQGVFSSADVDDDSSSTTYKLVSGLVNGCVERNNGASWVCVQQWTQADANAQKIRYSSKNKGLGIDLLTYQLRDAYNLNPTNFTLNIQVLPAPIVIGKASVVVAVPATGPANATGPLTSSDLLVTCVDTGPDDLTFIMMDDSSAINSTTYMEVLRNGSWTTLSYLAPFTQAEVNGGKLRVMAVGINETIYTIQLQVSNGGAPKNVTLVVNYHILPQVAKNTGLLVNWYSTTAIASSQLNLVSLTVSNPSSLRYTITRAPVLGSLSSSSFTQDDINNRRVSYTHSRSNKPVGNVTDSFGFSVTDDRSSASFPGDFFIKFYNVPPSPGTLSYMAPMR
ncbi:uncharacterized protein EV422DRAFT_166158 [Fimicolochytrium jonesii]|uniref:uncharacterized protein n=1 Tax=Fimicolochytrium jonesii TaxID=1396493 RepID=UPI0022FECBCD|nr:uncharacterized protein EV422DRAFT_166158 [Fimicolochytrium jonesii]KAI8818811.1 hypothetical protein EV422DRAFT_166158 [Fimicolochytrium jonesii]